MTEEIYTEEYKGYTIKIMQDTYPMSPREWDNLGTMVCFHRRYNLGDLDHGYNQGNYDSWKELREDLIKDGAAIILPLFLYDHGGLTMSTSIEQSWFHAAWDSGQVGVIFITREKIQKEYGWKVLTDARREKITQYLIQEVKTYDDYLTGNVYGYIVEDPEGEETDSCWGFYGDYDDYCLKEARSIVDFNVKAAEEKQWAEFQSKQDVPAFSD